MITWDNFYLFAIVAVALWILGAGFALFSNVKSRMAVILSVLGTITLGVFIAGFWISLQRPPLRTMGETRLWYSFFYGSVWTAYLSSVEVPLDFGFFYNSRNCVCFT